MERQMLSSPNVFPSDVGSPDTTQLNDLVPLSVRVPVTPENVCPNKMELVNKEIRWNNFIELQIGEYRI
jgi:hypothetical protein